MPIVFELPRVDSADPARQIRPRRRAHRWRRTSVVHPMATSSYATEPRPAAAGGSVVAGFWPRLRRFAHRHGRFAAGLAVALGLLAVVRVSRSYGPAGAGLIAGAAVAAALVAFSRRWDLSWSALGLSRRAWAKGGAVVAVAAVAVVYAGAAALPATPCGVPGHQVPTDHRPGADHRARPHPTRDRTGGGDRYPARRCQECQI